VNLLDSNPAVNIINSANAMTARYQGYLLRLRFLKGWVPIAWHLSQVGGKYCINAGS